MSTREEIAMWTNLTEARVRVSIFDLEKSLPKLSCFCDSKNQIKRTGCYTFSSANRVDCQVTLPEISFKNLAHKSTSIFEHVSLYIVIRHPLHLSS